MSATVAASILPIVSRRSLTTAEDNLVTLLREKASWIWTPEDTMPIPKAPVNVQRAFRKTFSFTGQSRPANITIMVAADDYFAMYVNGVLVQIADTAHDYKTVLAYDVPLPVVTGESAASVALGFRVINKSDNAGLLVAAQVNYEGVQAPDVFWTGKDQTWLGEVLFPEHWEQPWFDSTTQASSWRPAIVYTAEELNPTIPSLVRQEVMVMGALSADTGNIPAPTPLDDLCSGSECSRAIGLSKGAFAGVVVGSVVLAFLLGSVISFLLARRKYSDRIEQPDSASMFWGVAPAPQVAEYQPTTKPGRPQHHGPHYAFGDVCLQAVSGVNRKVARSSCGPCLAF